MAKKRRGSGSPRPPAQSETASPSEGAEGTERPSRTAFDSFRENAEALVVAVILAIIIRHFAVEAFEIPTGSMAPTLYGMHVWVECPNCPEEYPVAVHTDSSTGEIHTRFPSRTVYRGECPNPKCELDRHARSGDDVPVAPGRIVECQSCGESFQGQRGAYETAPIHEISARCPKCAHRYIWVAEADDIDKGNKILVNKFAYPLGPVRRWDVVVFEFDQWKNYIKRVVGLPGETIHLYAGDVYVEGEIVRKPDHPYVQDVMWREISDSDLVENGLADPAWTERDRDGAGNWTPEQERTRWSVNHPGGNERPAAIEYRRPLDNYESYNMIRNGGRGSPPGLEIGDLGLRYKVTPLGVGGWVGAEIRDGEFTFRAEVPVGKASKDRPAALYRVDGGEDAGPGPEGTAPGTPRETAVRAVPAGVASVVELENVDDCAILSIDGEEVLRIDYVSVPRIERAPRAGGQVALRILGHGVQAELRSIRVRRDAFYGPMENHRLGRGTWGPLNLDAGQYLALGDNSASSSDGRVWGYVPEGNLMGKALLVFWPAWPLNFQCKFIR